VRLLAIRVSRDQVYRFVFISPPELTPRLTPAFRETGQSFRRLGEQEAAAVQPLVVRIRTVKPGETVQSLAAGMPFPGFNDDLFRVLNGLDGQGALSTGRAVKVIDGGGGAGQDRPGASSTRRKAAAAA
jgi:predicted Zn-dependent protease